MLRVYRERFCERSPWPVLRAVPFSVIFLSRHRWKKEKRGKRKERGKFSFTLYRLSLSLSLSLSLDRPLGPAWPISSGFSRRLEYFARGLEISDPRNSPTDTSPVQLPRFAPRVLAALEE